MNKTKIEWADYTWNPVTGCLHGCEYCYARRMAKRFSRGTGKGVNPPAYYIPGAGYIRDTEHNSFIENANIHVVKWPMYDEWIIREGEYNYRYDPFPYGFEPTFHRYRLDEPQQVKNPSKIFVCSMADLFGDWVPDEWIERVFNVAMETNHQYLFLTKNPKRYNAAIEYFANEERGYALSEGYWDNFWFGTTITSQEDIYRIPDLLKFPEGHKFISIEPMLGPVDLTEYFSEYDYRPTYEYYREFLKMQGIESDGKSALFKSGLDWVICGGETGPKARPMHPDWVRSLRDQCQDAGVPFFFKSWGEWSADYTEHDKRGVVAFDGWWSEGWPFGYGLDHPNSIEVYKVGKKKAGRMLDGRTWDEIPEL